MPPDEGACAGVQSATGSNGLKPDSMASRIVRLLGAHPTRRFDAAAIASELRVTNINSLRGTLLRLANTKYIEKAGRGGFQARKEPRA